MTMPTVRSVTYSAEVTLPEMTPEQEIEFYKKIDELVNLPEFRNVIQVDNTLTTPSYLIVYSENFTDRESFLDKVEEIYPHRPAYKTIPEIVAEIVAVVTDFVDPRLVDEIHEGQKAEVPRGRREQQP